MLNIALSQNDIIENNMVFPNGANKAERIINWRKIAEISDKDFGFDNPKEKTDGIRFCVRVLLFNDKNEICVIKSEKYGYTQLPGGGIENDESIIDALKRETKEETGWLISDIEPIGYTLEKRKDKRNAHPWGKDISYVFKAIPIKQVGTNYMEDEIAEGFQPIWLRLKDFITEKERRKAEIKSYSGCFSDRRDLLIAKYFQNKILK